MPIVIDVKIKSGAASSEIAKIETNMKGVWDYSNKANASINKLNIALSNTKQLAREVVAEFKEMAASVSSMALKMPGRGGGGGSGGSGGGGGRSYGSARAVGPAQRMVMANQRLAALQASGTANWAQLYDAQQAAQRAYSNFSKSQVVKAPPVQGMAKVMATSRVAIGPNGQMQLMPILGQMMKAGANPSVGGILNMATSAASGVGAADAGAAAAGLGAVSGPAMAAAGAVAILALSTKVASDALSSWGRSLAVGGGSGGQARSAQVLSDALGINVTALGQNLMNGYGPVVAGAAGVNPFGGPFGNNQYNQKGLQVLDLIHNAKSFDQARRYAEMAGQPEAAQSYYLSKETYGALRHTTEGEGSEENIRKAAEFNANLAIASNNLKDLAIAIAGPVISAFNDIELAGEAIGKWISDHLPGQKTSSRHMDVEDRKMNATNRNTDATNKNTDATNRLREGLFGGGPRAQGAVGRGMNPSLNPGVAHQGYGVL
jgi:hypothetical protein